MKKIIFGAILALGLSVVAYASTIRATLSWIDSTGEDGYRIERGNSSTGLFSPLASVPADTISYVDNTLVSGTNYCWRVIAFNAVGDAAPSTPVCANAPSLPTPVGGLQVIITVTP